jgi:perosamine synthetase
MSALRKPLQWPTWPKYNSEHENAVLRVIRSNQLYAATEVRLFEHEFSEYTGSKYAIGVGNATQGLHLALAALGIGPGDEVIVTPYSWVSSASCVLMQGAIPVFVDIEAETFGLDPFRVEDAISPRTKAVILVHMFGLPAKVKEIYDVCSRHGIFLIEDASHAHGAIDNAKHLGSFGAVGVFSLHQRKAISTGDGGILITGDTVIYDKLRRMRSFGADRLSYNYRMTEFSAALARIGLSHLDRDNMRREENHKLLLNNLRSQKARVIQGRPDTKPVFYSNLIDLDLPYDSQQQVLFRCNEAGIPLKRTWQPLNKHPHFKRENMPNKAAPWDCISSIFVEPKDRNLSVSLEFQERRLFELDCHPLVPQEDVVQAAAFISVACDEAT